jgi:hypothetical protein
MTPAHAEVEKSTRSVVGNDLLVVGITTTLLFLQGEKVEYESSRF